MRHSLVAIAAAATLLAACGKDPAPVIQPGVPAGQAQQPMVQPQEPQQYQQPSVAYQQPAPVAPQPTVIVQQPAQAQDHTGTALVAGMALGALMNSGGNTTVYRDRYVPTPAPSYYEPAYRNRETRSSATANVIVQAPTPAVQPQVARTNLGSATLPISRPSVATVQPVARPATPAPAPVKVAPPPAPVKVAPAPVARPATPPATKPSSTTASSKR